MLTAACALAGGSLQSSGQESADAAVDKASNNASGAGSL
jgi:hypothetical protein